MLLFETPWHVAAQRNVLSIQLTGLDLILHSYSIPGNSMNFITQKIFVHVTHWYYTGDILTLTQRSVSSTLGMTTDYTYLWICTLMSVDKCAFPNIFLIIYTVIKFTVDIL